MPNTYYKQRDISLLHCCQAVIKCLHLTAKTQKCHHLIRQAIKNKSPILIKDYRVTKKPKGL